MHMGMDELWTLLIEAGASSMTIQRRAQGSVLLQYATEDGGANAVRAADTRSACVEALRQLRASSMRKYVIEVPAGIEDPLGVLDTALRVFANTQVRNRHDGQSAADISAIGRDAHDLRVSIRNTMKETL